MLTVAENSGYRGLQSAVTCNDEVPLQKRAQELLERVRHYALAEGDVPYRGTWLRQEGEIRFAPDRPWLPFIAEEWFSSPGIDFCWRAWTRRAPLGRARVVDLFRAGRGSLTVWMFGVLPVLRLRGSATDQGEALRGLGELLRHPSAFRDTASLHWQAHAPDTLQATLDDRSTRVPAEFQIDSVGRVVWRLPCVRRCAGADCGRSELARARGVIRILARSRHGFPQPAGRPRARVSGRVSHDFID